MHFSAALSVPAFLTLANAAVIGKRAASGEATFYGGNVAGGACSFSTYTLPSNIFGTALSDSNWDNSANCGACVSVTGPDGNAITAMIVDECPGCGLNHLDLFPTAFSALANPSTGIIDVAWSYVDCPITSPLQLHQKEGVSVYWFSMQVVNANKAVSKLEVSTDGGSTWQGTTRQTYNFFENSSGFGVKTMDIKVTSSDGEEVIVKNVEVGAGSSVTADSNFASSGSTAGSTASSSVAASSSTSTPSSTAAAIVSTSETPLPVTTSSVPGANFQQVSSSSSIASSAPTAASSSAAIIPTTSTTAAAPQYTPTSTLPTPVSTSAFTTSTSTPEPTFVYVDACEL